MLEKQLENIRPFESADEEAHPDSWAHARIGRRTRAWRPDDQPRTQSNSTNGTTSKITKTLLPGGETDLDKDAVAAELVNWEELAHFSESKNYKRTALVKVIKESAIRDPVPLNKVLRQGEERKMWDQPIPKMPTCDVHKRGESTSFVRGESTSGEN